MENKDLVPEKTNSKGQTLKEFLVEYCPKNYEKPSVTADILIFTLFDKIVSNKTVSDKELKILLIKRKDHPYIDDWALPGGFLNIDENLDNTAIRELEEEANIKGVYLEQLYTFGDLNRDPRMRIISTAYMALINNTKLNAIAGDDASDVKWFSINTNVINNSRRLINEGFLLEKTIFMSLKSDEIELTAKLNITKTIINKCSKTEISIIESNGIAFDHCKIIYMGLERLKNKLEYTSIAFNFVPEKFTFTELQKVYEAIWGKELTKSNFRVKINNMVIDTNEYKQGVAYKPPKLYKFNPQWEFDNF